MPSSFMGIADQRGIWINPTLQNYKQLINACNEFGLPILDMTEENFLHNDSLDVFTYGRSPVSIDIMKSVKGCNFSEAFALSKEYIENELNVRFVHKETLLQAKRASGRFKDLDDIEKLNDLY